MISKFDAVGAQPIDQQAAGKITRRHMSLDGGSLDRVSGAARSPDRHLLVNACLVHLHYPTVSAIGV